MSWDVKRYPDSEQFYEKIDKTEKQLKRKYEILKQQTDYTELLDEASLLDAEKLGNLLLKKIDEADQLIATLEKCKADLKEAADNDMSEVIADLEMQIAQMDDNIAHVKKLADMADLMEATEACGEDASTALKYIEEMEKSTSELDEWSNGKLAVLESISQFLVNKRYTLESEKRKKLLSNETEEKSDIFDTEETGNGDGNAEISEKGEWMSKARLILQQSLEPSEEMPECGGLGNIKACQVSVWLQNFIDHLLANWNYVEDAVNLYISIYNQSLKSASTKGIAIFYNNSIITSHRILLRSLVAPSRGAVNSAIILRKFADQRLLEKVQQIRFNATGHAIDGTAFREYPKFLKGYGNSFKDILPVHVYEKLLRLIVEHFVSCLISLIINMEDIESTQADQFASLVSDVLQDLEGIVPKGLEIRVWSKAAELKNILAYGLKDFAVQWKDSSSQLRKHYSAEEVKHLVRSIFQNSDMRSSVISQIY